MASAEAGTVAAGGRIVPALGLSWPLLVAALAYLGGLSPRMLNDPDTYWHLAAANWIFEHLSIPAVDPFSHTMRGAPWVAHEWLSEVLLGAAFRLAGWSGPVVLASAAFAAALAMVCRHLLRHLEPIYALGLTALAALLIQSHLLARPHALVFPLIAAWGIALIQAREAGRPPAWPWALLMALWANLHGSFPLGLGLAAFFAVEAVGNARPGERRQTARAWGSFVVLAVLAALLTPHGVRGFTFATDVGSMEFTLNYIDEWRSLDFHQFQPLELVIMVGALAVFLRGFRLPFSRSVLVLGLLHLALVHGRHADVLGLLVPVVVAEELGRQWRRQSGGSQTAQLDQWFDRLVGPARPLGKVAIFALLLGATAWVGRSAVLVPPPSITPEAAIRAAQAAVPAGPVMNSYHFGGYLIFSGIAPGIDGRADMYGDAFVAEYSRALALNNPERFIALLERYHIGWTLLVPDSPAIALLDRLPGWRRIHTDKTAVVHMKF